MRISRKTCFCLLISFVFTVLLVVTIGYRILQSDRVSMPLPLPHAEGTMLKGTEAGADFRFTYRWNLRDCPTDTEILGDLEPPATQQVEGEAIWCIELIAENGKLTLKANPPALQSTSPLCKINARFCITEKPPVVLRMPNTTLHTQRHFVLACELAADYGFGYARRTCYLQELVVDLVDGAADLQQVTIPPSLRTMPRHHVLKGAESGLPERFCGTTTEKELLHYLFHLAMVEDTGTAAALLPGLKNRAERLVRLLTDKDKPWPDCWGSGADTAREISHRVQPLLRHMQDNNCYNSAELAEFVNGALFSRIFGPPTH